MCALERYHAQLAQSRIRFEPLSMTPVGPANPASGSLIATNNGEIAERYTFITGWTHLRQDANHGSVVDFVPGQAGCMA